MPNAANVLQRDAMIAMLIVRPYIPESYDRCSSLR